MFSLLPSWLGGKPSAPAESDFERSQRLAGRIDHIPGALVRRSHVSTQGAEYYLRPEHKDHQVAIVIRLFMTGRHVTSLSAMMHLREMANLSVRADNVIREAELAFRRAGIPMQSEWVKVASKKRIKARWLDKDALRKLKAMRGA